MLNTVFYLLMAGCPETAGACAPLPAPETAYVSIEACEEELLRAMPGASTDWPEVHAICVPGQVNIAAVPPAAWPRADAPLQVADAQ